MDMRECMAADPGFLGWIVFNHVGIISCLLVGIV